MGSRQFSEIKKRAVLAAMTVPGAKATDVADAHGVNKCTVYAWMREAKEGKFQFQKQKEAEPATNPVVREQPDPAVALELAFEAIRVAFVRAKATVADEAIKEYRRALREWVDEN